MKKFGKPEEKPQSQCIRHVNCKHTRHNKRNKRMANSSRRIESLVWTDSEVELLLRVTLDYKTAQIQKGVDWESCHSKYGDITEAFQAEYPGDAAEMDFPHKSATITKPQITTKLKSIRTKYRHALDSGRRSGHGRAVLIFHELCEQIWGESTTTTALDHGLESRDVGEETKSPLSADDVQSSSSVNSPDSLPPAATQHRRDLRQARPNTDRGERLKRKDPVNYAREELELKKAMVDAMLEGNRRSSDSFQQLTAAITQITNSMNEGLAVLKEMLSLPAFTQPQHTAALETSTAEGQLKCGSLEIKLER